MTQYQNRKNSASKTYSNSHGGLKLNKNGSQSVSREQGGCLHILYYKEETFSDHWGKDAIGDEEGYGEFKCGQCSQ